GCVSTPADGPCDDGNACTIGDHCAGGKCGHDGALYCEDFNPCTDEACDPLLGCIHTVNTAPCEDEDACTVGDTCAGGECLGGPPPDCDDQDPCTAESCDAVLGCQYQNACVGWHVVALVPAAVTAQPLASGTLTLTVGQPGAGPKQGPQLSIHVGLGPITTVE
ncbi:MAG: hypothetical protein FJ098_04665, partial [Deltaproteobacteria bacterium]|nr:hypothetical protein [Deltaproteobacteria bacterium]